MLKNRIVVLGAGISGLALAWYLRKQIGRKVEITILEKAPRAGGWIQTLHKEGFIFEQGPRSCRSRGNGLATLKLIEELGLRENVIVASPAARQRFLYTGQQLRRLPSGAISLLFSPFLSVFAKALWKDARGPAGNAADESVYEFISRRLGDQVAEDLVDPLATGIYAGDIRKLSVKCSFPILYEWERQHGSLLKGMLLHRKMKEETETPFAKIIREHSIFTLQEGMESLVHALAKSLSKELKLSCGAERLRLLPDAIEVEAADKSIIRADHVYSALPPRELAKLLAEHDGCLAEKLNALRSTSVAVVNLGYRKKVLPHEGFGYLIPSREGEEILGVVWDSSAFAQQNNTPEETRLTVMIGGEHMPDFHNYTESDYLGMAVRSLAKHLNITCDPDALAIKIAAGAIPQYLVGHEEFIGSVQKNLKRLSDKITLAGNGFHGVSVNDCIANAQKTCYEQYTARG